MKSPSKLNGVYRAMKARCYNPNVKSYKDYGGRGITICDEWLNPEKVCTHYGIYTKGWRAFEIWALSNGYKEGLTIDRIDNNKGYSPDNCRWVDKKTQSNNRGFCRLITYRGKTQNLKQWCEELGINYKLAHRRLSICKWTVEQTFETKENPLYNLISYNGKTQTVAAWARELNLSYGTLRARLFKYKMPVDRALTKEPPRR